MYLLAYSTSSIFFHVRLIQVLRLIICVLLFIYFFNNPLFLVKVRLLSVCLVLENLKEKGKEIERKKNEGNKYNYSSII